MEERIYNCAIVGGGISGVSLAYYLSQSGRRVLLLDNKEKAGGQIQTGRAVGTPGFWYETGAHTCYNSYVNLISLVLEAGLREFVEPLLKHGYAVYSRGKIKSIFSEISVLQMIPVCFKYFSANKAGKTVKEFFRPLAGAKNYDRLLRYAFGAVICQPADDYPAEIFLKKRDEKNEAFPRKFSFRQGISSFIDSVITESAIDNQQSTEIVNISKENDIFILEAKDGKRYQSRKVALAVDPKSASELLKNIEPEISALLSTISLFRSESLNVIVPKNRLKVRNVSGIIGLTGEFMSAVSRDPVSDERVRSFTFHFEKGKLKLPEMINLICKVLNISESDIIEQKYTEHALSVRRMQDIDIESKIDNLLKDKQIYITGNYFKGLSMEDCVTRSKREADRFLISNLNKSWI